MLSTSVALRYDQNSRYNGTFNPKLGLVFKPADKITTKFLYGSAFLAPSMFYAGQHFGSFSGKDGNTYTSTYFMIPNPNLKPEKIDTFEFNADYQLNKDFNIGLNFYHNTLKGIIFPSKTATAVSDYIPGGSITETYHHDNVGKAIS